MFSKFFIERPRFAMVISIVMTLAGAIAVFSLPISLYPQITPPTITVQAAYPGASADVLARTVGIPIEQAVNGVEGMMYMDSTSNNNGRYTLTVTFEVGTDPDMAQVKVQNRVQQAINRLPADVQQQGVSVFRRSNDTLGFIVAHSPNGTFTRLQVSDYIQNNVRENLTRVDGVGEVNVFAPPLSMRVWLDADKIAALNIPLSTISSAILSQNVQPSLGKIGAMPGDGTQQLVYTLLSSGRINDVEEFKKIIVRTAEDGGLVRLEDISTVELGQENYAVEAQFNGSPSVAIAINLLSGANALQAMTNLKTELDRLAATYPEDLEVFIAFDATEYIESSIAEAAFTLMLTFLLVVAVCYAFLQDWRATLIPSLTIPVSIFATFAVLLALGYSLNMLTLFGLVLAITLVVDDGIVVVERVLHIMENEKLPPKEATIKAMSQVSSAIIATTLVLLAIFVPIGFLGGITGKIYQQFAITISTAFIFSSINALTLSPALCATILRPLKPFKSGPLHWLSETIDDYRNLYASIVAVASRKISVIATIFGLIVLGIAAILTISQTTFLPNEDQGVIMADIRLPEGASRQRSQDFVNQIVPEMIAEEGVDSCLVVIGMSMLSGAGENVAFAVLRLDNWSDRASKELYSTNIMNRLRAKLSARPEAVINFFEMPAIAGLGSTNGLDFRFQAIDSDDAQKLDEALQTFLAKVNQSPYTLFAFTNYNATTPHLFLEIDRAKAESMKVTTGSIYGLIGQYLGSAYINDVNFGTQVNRVILQADWPFRKNIEDINSLYVQNASGQIVPLGGLVNTKKVLAPSNIYRYNQYPAATITIMSNPRFSTSEAMVAMEQLALEDLPRGYGYQWSGMSYQEKDNKGQVGYLLVLSIIFAYLFLVAQYESWSIPLSVISSVSVAMAGALVGLFLHALPLSIYAQLGLVLMVGLSAKNAILIVEFSREEREKGASISRAAMIGLKERFRAVLMTASTFILGVLPMVLATGAGANSRIAIGVPVFYGMLIGTLLGLILIPMLYVLFQTLTEKLFPPKIETVEE